MKAALVLLLFAAYPPSYRWQTITTEHFYIHYHQGEEQLAPRAARMAEDVHARIAPLMGWTPRERTHVILTDHVDASNGSATTFPFNRIEIYVSAPGADPSSPIEYYDNWLNLVLTHEYAHILHLDQSRGAPRLLQRVFGRIPLTFPNSFSPLWMTEGLATLIESEATDAGRLKGTFLDMVLRTAAEENRWPAEAQASGLTATWPAGNARYLFGSKFLSWLKEREGLPKLTEYLQRYSGTFFPYNVNGPARAVFGQTISTLYEEWSAEQQSVYRADVERIRRDGLTTARRLTSLGFQTKYTRVSPDGRLIAFANAGPYEWPSIRVIETATGREVARKAVNSPSPLSWSADNTTLAYSQLEYVRSVSLLSDAYTWNIRSGEARRLTSGARIKDPAFTPDRRTLIAVDNRGGRNRLVEIDTATGAVRSLIEPRDFTQFSEPAVSQDGNTIAVAEWNKGRIDIVLYNRSGRRLRNVTEQLPKSTNASPFFLDGSLYFSSDVTGVPNIFVAEREASPRRLSNVYGGAFFPSTADGRTIYYTDYSSRGFDVAAFEAGSFSTEARVAPVPLSGTGESAIAGGIAPQSCSPWQSLRPRWWLPQFDSDGRIGAVTAGSDALGFHNYSVSFAGSKYSVAYINNRYYPALTFVADNDRLIAGASFPFLRLRRQWYAGIGAVREHEIDLNGLRTSLTFNNAYELGYSISPENGIRAIASHEQFRSLQTTFLDLRGYRGLPLSRTPSGRHAIALRVAGGRTTGDRVPQRDFLVGGAGAGEFVTFQTTELPVRGFDTGRLRGREAAIASLEYRFPLWQIDRGPTTLPFFFHRLLGDVFADAGRVPGETIASVGAEAGVDMVVGFFAPLRYRVGAAYLARGGSGVKWFAALSSSF